MTKTNVYEDVSQDVMDIEDTDSMEDMEEDKQIVNDAFPQEVERMESQGQIANDLVPAQGPEKQQQIANDPVFAEFLDKKRQTLIAALISKFPALRSLPRANVIPLWLADMSILESWTRGERGASIIGTWQPYLLTVQQYDIAGMSKLYTP